MFAVLICFTCAAVHAQQAGEYKGGVYDFAPGDKVIFEDYFNKNTADEQHLARWFTWPCNGKFGYLDRKYFDLEPDNQNFILKIRASSDAIPVISPLIGGVNYLSDTFTVEYDFALGAPGSSVALCFDFSKKLGNCLLQTFDITNDNNKGLLFTYHHVDSDSHAKPRDYTVNVPCQSPVYHTWRRFAFSYKNHLVKCYLDTSNIMEIPDCGFTPAGYHQKFTGPVEMRYIQISKGIGVPSVFNKLLTDKKFTTHAILFDLNKSTITKESMPFIVELAEWLKKNPNVNLEIDGHTDSGGDPSSNMKLSQERADEVKNQLTSMGIFIKRLTTKGYGATKPIQSNDTPEGRANNRRVELIKI